MTTTSPRLRADARQIIAAALQAVDPARAVSNYFAANPALTAQIRATPGRILVVGGGKASAPMARAAAQLFGDSIAGGCVVVKYGHTEAQPHPNLHLVEAGHPVPDDAGLAGARQIRQLLADTTPADTVICLISGGGSALLTLPAEGLTLADLQATTTALLAAGSTINEINTIRKHLSAVKGGQLARLAAPARLVTLILSDVVGDPLEIIASGPTVPDPSTFADAWGFIEHYNLACQLPQPVTQRLQAGARGDIADTPKPGDPIFERAHNAIIGSNRIAAQAAVQAAETLGYRAQLLSTFIEGEAREVGRVMAGLAKGISRGESPLALPACLVLGGETTVTIRGQGKGGRNQEMALAAAIALEGWPDALVVCLGTDGNDGPTDAAGALADGHTTGRAAALGLDARQFLANNDAYSFFGPLDDLIITGPTNTNVNDLTLVLVA
ncbi:MAG: glycerate kinase [Anaerolineae bacterium]